MVKFSPGVVAIQDGVGSRTGCGGHRSPFVRNPEVSTQMCAASVVVAVLLGRFPELLLRE